MMWDEQHKSEIRERLALVRGGLAIAAAALKALSLDAEKIEINDPDFETGLAELSNAHIEAAHALGRFQKYYREQL